MIGEFQVRPMDDGPTHCLMHCRRNRDCEVAKNQYIIYRSPDGLINQLPGCGLDTTHWVKSALRTGVVIESFHARYTFTQKRPRVIVSTDVAMIKSQKYAK